MARGPEFPKVRHIAVSAGERSAGADAVILPFEVVQPEPPEPAQGAPEGALPAAAEDPALHAGAQADAPAATGAPPPPPAQPVTVARIVAVDLARARSDDHSTHCARRAQRRGQPGLRTVRFGGAREALRFGSAVEAVKRAALRARDEARRGRGVEIAVLGRAASLNAASLAACRHLDGLVFDLPSLDPEEALLPLLAARAALGLR